MQPKLSDLTLKRNLFIRLESHRYFEGKISLQELEKKISIINGGRYADTDSERKKAAPGTSEGPDNGSKRRPRGVLAGSCSGDLFELDKQ